MAILPNPRFGTEEYPEKIARRLRIVNVATWLVAAGTALFAIKRPWDPDRITIIVAICLAMVPLLHRFGPVAAPVALIGLVYIQACRIILEIGTGDGIILNFLLAAPVCILVLGVERAWIAAILAFLGAALAIGLNLIVPHDTGAITPTALAINFSVNFACNVAIAYAVMLYVARQADRAEIAAERERERSEALLANMLPPTIAERLKNKSGEGQIADAHAEATVLFMDMAGFTSLAGTVTPNVLVQFLNNVYTRLDDLVEQHGLEKIKTSGDAYMVVGGVPEAIEDHAGKIAALALDARKMMGQVINPLGQAMSVRIGIATGTVVAGVVGKKKFFYDVWGDAVNIASRMETTAEPGEIQVSASAFALLRDRFEFRERGVVDVRGKGTMRTWYLSGVIERSLAE